MNFRGLLTGLSIASLVLLGNACGKNDYTVETSASTEALGPGGVRPMGGDPNVCGFANLLLNNADASGVARLEYVCKTAVGESWNFGFVVGGSGYRIASAQKKDFTFTYDSSACVIVTANPAEFFRLSNPVLVNGQLDHVRLSLKDYSGSSSPYLTYELDDCSLLSVVR